MISFNRLSRIEDWSDVLARSPEGRLPGSDHTLRQLLLRSVITWVGRYDGEIACVWGLVPPTLLSDKAYLWSLITDLVEEHKFLFVRYSQIAIELLLEKYPTIIGSTDPGRESTIRWLKWLGAEFIPAADGKLYFMIRKKADGI